MESDVGLVNESTSVCNGEICGETGKARNEIILPRLDCLLGSIGVLIICWNIFVGCAKIALQLYA